MLSNKVPSNCLVSRILKCSELGSQSVHGKCSGPPDVQDTLLSVFGEFFRVYHRTEVNRLQSDLAATTALTVKKQTKARLQCARRMQNICWPSGRRLRLAGIKTVDGSVVSCPKLVQKELIDHWKPIYGKKPIDLNLAKTLLGLYERNHKDVLKILDNVACLIEKSLRVLFNE